MPVEVVEVVIEGPQGPAGTGFDILSSNRTYYVNGSTGSDGNTGLASGSAFATIQKAVDTIVRGLIIPQGITVSVSVADTTYSETVVVRPWMGGGSVTFTGNTSTPANVVIQGGSGTALTVTGPTPGTLTFAGFKLQATSGTAVAVSFGGTLNLNNANFGAASVGHVDISFGGRIVLGSYTISGNAGFHWHVANQGVIFAAGITVTLTGTPAFTYFAGVSQGGVINALSNTYSGSATGQKFICHNFGTIYTGSAISQLPGDASGDADQGSGGFYVTNGGVIDSSIIGIYTIASGAITVTNGFALVDTEGATSSDDLDTINGGRNGEHIYLSALDSSHTVVLKNGTGNIVAPTDITLDNANDVAHLIYNPVTSKWCLVSSSNNGA